MSTDTTYRCDGPVDATFELYDHCVVHGSDADAFITVLDRERLLHFCTWDCLLRFAGKMEPSEVIDL